MRLLSPSPAESGIYDTVHTAPEKVTLWRSDSGLWWAVVQTYGPPEAPGAIVEVAYAIDKSERTDAAIMRWATAAYERAKHPEDEQAETL